MSSDWAIQRLENVVSFKTGKLDSNAAEKGGIYPFFTCSPTTSEINTFAFDTEAVILAGNNANGVFATKYYSGKFNAYQRTYVIEPLDPELVSCKYMYYVISDLVGHLKELSVGTATKFLTKTILNGLQISLPPKSKQDEIAELLSTLDDRVELLRETNTTLEAIAQTLFKSWFVDFDPVHAKAKGLELEGIDAATAELFPDSFEESELGLVPRGWAEVRLGQICSFQKGCSYKGDGLSDDQGAYMFNLGCFNSPRVFAFEKVKRYTGDFRDKHCVSGGDLIIANTDMTQHRAILGRPLLVPDGMAPSFVSHHVFKVVISKACGAEIKHFLFFCFLQPSFRERAVGYATGTTVLALPKDALEQHIITLPGHELLRAFADCCEPIFSSIQANEVQAKTLTKLRDTLLPRLISGQLHLPEAEAQIEAVYA
ncbi:restriction endonuclease subunit S [Pseudomonas sp. KK4]|uniref:restriction endonuclease subunit S n=1 Tax=Pseudomonas sp. KK4 TaxID=1855729 RepID=UPI00097CA55E|nr:restriction endonuclease subunit S [Pseudomonas sp. KK4]